MTSHEAPEPRQRGCFYVPVGSAAGRRPAVLHDRVGGERADLRHGEGESVPGAQGHEPHRGAAPQGLAHGGAVGAEPAGDAGEELRHVGLSGHQPYGGRDARGHREEEG